jgi:hypothetical protein
MPLTSVALNVLVIAGRWVGVGADSATSGPAHLLALTG